MIIEFVDLKRQYRSIKKLIEPTIKRVLNSQYFILGKELENFERSFAKYIGCRYAIGVDNGSDGLVLALKAFGIKVGDEVITPVNSYISTTFSITEVGAKPIFVDVDPETHQLNINEVKRKITKKTRAILPVHLYGAPCNIIELTKICKKKGLVLIEDACQAHGATMLGQKLGTFGQAGVFSFYPGKNLGAYGNGGAIVTNNKRTYDKLLKLRNFGQNKKYYHETIGQNSKLDDLQAAILSEKLKLLDKWNQKRNYLAKLYIKKLKGFKMPKIIDGGRSNYHLFILECKKRNELLAYLKKNGIKAQIHYPVPIHLQKCYEYLGHKKGDFPVAEKLTNNIISLPLHPELTEKEVVYTTRMIHNFYGNS